MLTLSVSEKLKNSIFQTPLIPQTLNIDNLRTAKAKSINLRVILGYSFKNVYIFILRIETFELNRRR